MYTTTKDRLVLLLSLAGVALSAVLTYIHIRVHLDPTYESLCAVGETLNCETVAASVYSTVIGLPLSVLGTLFYLFIAVMAAWSLRVKRPVLIGLRAAMTLFGAAVSVGLFILSATVIRAFCLLCTATYGVNLALFVVTWGTVRAAGGLSSRLSADMAELKRSPMGLAVVAMTLLLILTTGPFGVFPRYWEAASWQSGVRFAHGVTDTGLPWIGAASPSLTIEEYFDFDCPACRNAHKKLRRILSKHRRTLRIVRHDTPRVACVAPSGADHNRCAAARAAICAEQEDRYWDWNDAVIAHPKPFSGPERESYEQDIAEKLGFDTAAFVRCMAEKTTRDLAVSLQKAGKERGVSHTPTYFVEDQKRVGLKQLLPLIEDRL